MLWTQKGFLTTSGQPIKIGKQVAELFDAIPLLSALPFIKVLSHAKAGIAEAKGSSLPDRLAKTAALQNEIN